MGIGNETAESKRDALGTVRSLAGLAVDDIGDADARPPLVLLHGLTFDRQMWQPALAELGRIDPGRRALAFDLPGHGESAGWESYDVDSIAHGVHRAVHEAGLDPPVIVGHSMAAIIATVYAAQFPARGVVNVDQPLETAAFFGFLRPIAEQLRGPGFPAIWEQFAASMHIELLPASAQQLVKSTSTPSQDLVLGYWRQILEQPAAELAEQVSKTLAALRAAEIPYLILPVDWEKGAEFAVAQFRFECARRLQDPEVLDLISRLRDLSPVHRAAPRRGVERGPAPGRRVGRGVRPEAVVPRSIMRALAATEHDEYRRPFTNPPDRRPTVTWPREIPLNGERADVVEIVTPMRAGSRIPTSRSSSSSRARRDLIGPQRDFCRSWPEQTEVTVDGIHFIQEDSPRQIGQAIAEWLPQSTDTAGAGPR